MQETDRTGEPPLAINHYAVRLPPYWPQHPEIWFLQVEARFSVSNVTSQTTHFSHLVAALPNEVALEVYDLLSNPPTTAPYDALKAAIIERTTVSERKRLQQLLATEELGDRRPSQLLRHMQALLRDRAVTFDPTLLRELFLQRLPSTVQMVLTTAADLTLPALALHADKIMEVAPPQASVQNVNVHQISEAQQQRFASSEEISELREELKNLSTLVASSLVSHSQPSRNSSRSARSSSRSSQSRRSSPSRSQSPDVQPCWYHRKFGSRAERCTQPRGWSGNKTREH